MITNRKHLGWYRPRNLPHFDSPRLPQFVTFRLRDSLPVGVASLRAGETEPAYRRRLETALDVGAGACWLSRPELAQIVRDGLLHGCGHTHDMHAFVIMPNHVHALTTFRENYRLCDVVRGWKSYSARRINAMLGQNGAFWQREYFDRFIRDEAHFERARSYIEHNPVSAGLTNTAESWRFGSLSGVGVRPDEGVGVDADPPRRATSCFFGGP